jgi:ribosomal protein L37AE/L43A
MLKAQSVKAPLSTIAARSKACPQRTVEELERLEAQRAREVHCRLHVVRLVDGHWVCTRCDWSPTELQLAAYEQGLKHGRLYSIGGGRR